MNDVYIIIDWITGNIIEVHSIEYKAEESLKANFAGISAEIQHWPVMAYDEED